MNTGHDQTGSELADVKSAQRTAGQEVRRTVRDRAAEATANEHLLVHVLEHDPAVVSAYMAIRTEIDPRATMEALIARDIAVCVPVIVGKGEPLEFRIWTPASVMRRGPFGAAVPDDTATVRPDVVVTPLLAFDGRGRRLGYGGGFYDRTLARLRRNGAVHAVGFAYAGQEVDEVPTTPTDELLDAVVTERGSRDLPDSGG